MRWAIVSIFLSLTPIFARDYSDFEFEEWLKTVQNSPPTVWKIPDDLFTLGKLLHKKSSVTTPIQFVYTEKSMPSAAMAVYPRTKTNPSNFPQIVIARSMFNYAQNYEEVACVLSHEIGHIVLKHYIDKPIFIDQSFDAWIAQKLKTIKGPLNIKALDEEFNKNFKDTFSAYERDNENESDRYAVDLLELAGISPKGCADRLYRMHEISPDYNDPEHDDPLDRALQTEHHIDSWNIPSHNE